MNIPALRGAYVYGDYKTGTIWAFRQSGGKVTEYGQVVGPNPIRFVASFAEDQAGNSICSALREGVVSIGLRPSRNSKANFLTSDHSRSAFLCNPWSGIFYSANRAYIGAFLSSLA